MTLPIFTDVAASPLPALIHAGPLAVITGAGLSTGSGIPAYRDRHGQWQHATPIQHQDFLHSAATRQRYWARSIVGWAKLGHAAPNRGHRALAALEQRGAVATVITQNVDGLHQHAGSRSVIELHGGIARVFCLSCGEIFSRAEVQTWLCIANPDFDVAPPTCRPAPDGDAHVEEMATAGFRVPACPSCHGILKPDVVFFGGNVPRERVAAATQQIENAAALLVVGSSLMVYSGFRFAELAHRLGKPVLAINQGVTRADPLLSAKIDDDCGHALEALLHAFDQPALADN